MDDSDPFDELFGLEDKYYQEGYDQGFQDGLHQSRLEARVFGIEKGYEKFIEMGRLGAKARLWFIELQQAFVPGQSRAMTLRDAGARSRLKKHLDVLLALVDLSTLSTANTDETVSIFDDRLKRAQAKCKVISRMIEEPGQEGEKVASETPSKAQLQDF